MNNQFTQPQKVVAVETNKQAIARDFGVKANEVAYLDVQKPIDEYLVLYDKLTQTSWFNTAANGTPISWIISNNKLELVTSTGSFVLNQAININTIQLLDPIFGDSLVGVKQPFPKTVKRTQHDKNAEYVSLYDFGAKGDGISDDTLAIQAAVDSGHRFIHVPVPVLSYRTTAPINVTNSVIFQGEGVEPYTVIGSPSTRGAGSWFFLDHPGKGFYINRSLGFSGVEFRSIGTYRTHSVPVGNTWSATVYDWDFELDDLVDVKFIDVCLLNPYKGIRVHGQQSRMWIDRLYGHPMRVGIQVDEAYDICRYNNIHFWCYWAQNQAVWNFTLANLDAFVFGRCDNHMLMNAFSIFHNRGILIINTPTGTANKLKLANVDLDRGYNGYVVDSAAIGHTAQMSNVTIQGETGVSGFNYGMAIYGPQCEISANNLDLRNFNGHALYAPGAYANIGISELYLSDWSLLDNTSPPINIVQDTGICYINGSKRFYHANNNAARYGGAGKVHTLIDKGKFNGTTSATGDIIITFSGNAIPNHVHITNFNNVSLTFYIINRTLSSVTVRVYAGSVALTSTPVSLGWEVSI